MSAADAPLIELIDVHKSYGGKAAADGLTLSVRRGECVVLLGPSGSGKSTALKLINRLVTCDRGEVRFAGRDVRSVPPEPLRRRMGYAIQSIGLFPHWSVARNVATVPALLGWPRGRIEARVDELLGLVGLPPADFRACRPHELSGGQQQRVGVARALAADPEVLLMDEPFGALDPLTRQELQRELARIQRTLAKTVVLVTHDVDEALRLATRIVLMDGGRVVQQAAPLELLHAPASEWVSEFLGRDELGLRRLALQTVGERMRPPLPAAPAGSAHATPPGGPPLAADATLRHALVQFLAQRRERLEVADADGRLVGVLHLPDLLGQDTAGVPPRDG
ncbi:MAG: ABC transporter ATP-binding protein [Rubrivivax sp.]|nr:ABC transporter ATP-binding protein [Rubrivivax sp.]